MTRARAALAAGLALAGCTRPPATASVDPGTPVVIVSIDTLRADRLPAWGYAGVATPALDRLRRDAILFQNAWAPTPMTLPSHVTLLTGVLPPRHGVRANAGFTFRGGDHPSLPALLKARGHATGAAVSSYVLRAETGLAHGFDFYEDGIDPPAGGPFAAYQRRGDVTATLAREWIEAQGRRPFFFFLHLYEPHVPYEPPEPFRSRYASPYDGEVAAADAILGALLDRLRAAGIYDRALVVVTSDHGEGLGDHGEDQHSILLYTEALRVPLLVKLPGGRRAGETVTAPAELADVLPTVTGLFGLATPAGVSGRSLLEPDAAAPTRTVYSETLYPRLALGWSELRSLAGPRWHLIQGPRAELYDLAADPRETRDLAAHEAALVARLQAELESRYPLRMPTVEGVAPEVAERLAALGYAGGRSAGAEAAGPRLDPRQGLPVFRRFQAAARLASEGRLAESEAELRRLLETSPALLEARLQLGDVLLQRGRAAEAAEVLSVAAASPGASGDVWIALGEARLREGKLAEAETAAARAMAQSPTRAHELRARVALRRGDTAAAEREIGAALQRARPRPSTLVLAAEARVHAGDFTGALARLDEAERTARSMRLDAVPGLEFQKGDVLARMGRVVEAEAAYRREIERFPRRLQAWTNLAVLLHLHGRGPEIEPLLLRMVGANHGEAAVQAAARTFEVLGDRARAAAWRTRAAARK